MRKFMIIALGILFSLQVSIANAEVMNYGVPAPTIFTSKINQSAPDSKPLITGVTFNDTVVDVYIDGVLNGRAQVANDPSGVASFAYKPTAPLADGEHVIYTVARSLDETVYSQNSEAAVVNLSHEAVAVTGLTTELGPNGKVRIIGYVPNNYEVQVFIGGREFVKFTPPTATYGNTTYFWYAPGLPNGDYRVGVVTKSPTGEMSELVEHVLTFGSMVGNETSDHTDDTMTSADDAGTVVVVEDTGTTNPVVVDDNQPSMEDVQDILDDLETSDEVMIINDDTVGDTKVVVDTTESGDVLKTDTMTGSDSADDVVVFGDQANDSSDEAMEEIDGGVSEEVHDNDSRNTGFGLLLIIAIVLAIWYVREKRKADTSDSDSQISMDELKRRLTEDKKIVVDADSSKAHVEVKNDSQNNQNNQDNNKSKKNKKKKKNRR